MELLSPFSKNVVWQLAKLTRSRCLTFWIHLGTVRPLLDMILNPLFKKKNRRLKNITFFPCMMVDKVDKVDKDVPFLHCQAKS